MEHTPERDVRLAGVVHGSRAWGTATTVRGKASTTVPASRSTRVLRGFLHHRRRWPKVVGLMFTVATLIALCAVLAVLMVAALLGAVALFAVIGM